MNWSNHPNITGIIYAGAPGEQTGPGLVDVLWGLNPRYPSGKLPFAISDVRYLPLPIGLPPPLTRVPERGRLSCPNRLRL